MGRAVEVLTSLPSSLGSFMSTAERVRLPDDCTVGYIVEGLLGVRLLHSPLFHSHLENLQRLPSGAVLQQVEDTLTWFSTPTRMQPSSQGVSSCSGLRRGLASEFLCHWGGGPWADTLPAGWRTFRNLSVLGKPRGASYEGQLSCFPKPKG